MPAYLPWENISLDMATPTRTHTRHCPYSPTTKTEWSRSKCVRSMSFQKRDSEVSWWAISKFLQSNLQPVCRHLHPRTSLLDISGTSSASTDSCLPMVWQWKAQGNIPISASSRFRLVSISSSTLFRLLTNGRNCA